MINDSVLEARLDRDTTSERRHSPRVSVAGELLVRWIGNAGGVHRYRLVDQSEHGYRLYSTLPIPTGTTATVNAFPGSDGGHTPPDDPVVVAWCRPGDASGFHVGLRRLQP